ncbi:MAG: LuxR C-terminal-related transcriptional regulator [Thermomicrobiales bacterium]
MPNWRERNWASPVRRCLGLWHSDDVGRCRSPRPNRSRGDFVEAASTGWVNSTSSATSSRGRSVQARRRAVLQLVAEGKANAEIASALFIGKRTVDTHVENILSKLDVRSGAAIAVALHEGLS